MSKFERNLKYIQIALKNTDYLSLHKTELSEADVRYLQAKDLLVQDRKQEFQDGDISLILTSKGITYFDDKKQEFKSRFVWSVFTPVFLSVITTLITLWFNHLLK